jgi:hypothetical protein
MKTIVCGGEGGHALTLLRDRSIWNIAEFVGSNFFFKLANFHPFWSIPSRSQQKIIEGGIA